MTLKMTSGNFELKYISFTESLRLKIVNVERNRKFCSQSSFLTIFGLPMVKNGQNAGVACIYFSYCGPILRRKPGSSSSFTAKTIYVDATDANNKWPLVEFTGISELISLVRRIGTV